MIRMLARTKHLVLSARLASLACTGLLALASFTGCLDGSQNTPFASSLAVGTLTVVSYTTSVATLLAQGQINYSGVTAGSVVQFHTTSTCADTSVGQGLESDFISKGITVQVPSTSPSPIYVSAVGLPDCELFATYTAVHTAPSNPTFLSTSPASPSRVSFTPLVKGQPTGATATVSLYSDSACTNLLGAGPAGAFATAGIFVTLQPNTTTQIYVTATEPFGATSACGLLTSYTHTTNGPGVPTFVSVTPVSPSNQSTTPNIVGAVDTNTQNVTLFGDSGCSATLASGTAVNFTSTGIQVTVAANATTPIYGISYDSTGAPSVCGFLTSFTNDTLGPASPPIFVRSTPGLDLPSDPACVSAPCPCASPAGTCVTNATIHPLIIGSTLANDAVTVTLFSNSGCTTQIGSGTVNSFISTGIAANIVPNSTTKIFAESFDAAGNSSQCALLLNYTHNTIAPDAPSITAILPGPYTNVTTTPTLQGSTSTSTTNVLFFSDAVCSVGINSGTASDFGQNGITVNAAPTSPAPNKFSTIIYAQSEDAEGNLSACTQLTTFNYSNIAAPTPTFSRTLPTSPSRFTNKPNVVGAADSTITNVTLYSDNQCLAQIGTGNRATFTGAGIQITAANNTQTTVYAVAKDVYNNLSLCAPLLNPACTGVTSNPGVCTYIYETRAPSNPVFSSINPHVSGQPSQALANNYQTNPTLFGSVPVDPFNNALTPTTITFYDTYCYVPLSAGTPAAFASVNGIQVAVPTTPQITQIVAQVADAAGNTSACTPLTNYTYDNYAPGKPIFTASLPASPSYTQTTAVSGTIAASPDTTIYPMNDTNYTVVLYSDQCQTQLAQGPPSLFTSAGISILAAENQTTSIYGAIFDTVGNYSSCNLLTNFVHSDVGPANLLASQNLDGTISLSWATDNTASPVPNYVVKRSLQSGGPYTVLSFANSSTSFTDYNITNGVTYYYVVAATNNTGTSHDSSEYSITATASTPGGAVSNSLTATPGFSQVSLSWLGMSSDSTFKVLRAPNTGGPYTTIAAGLTARTYIDTSVTNGSPYFYVVEGTNADGDSIQSTEASAVPLAQGSAPTHLSIASIGGCVLLTWSSPSYYNSFIIRRGYSSGTETNYATVNANTNSYYDCSVYGYSFYSYYEVAATWGSQISTNSNEVIFANDNAPTMTASPGANSVYLQWNINSPNPSSYTISRSPTSGGPYTVLAANQTGSSYNDAGLTNGTAYYYIIQPVFANGATSWGPPEVSAIPGANPSAPTNLRVLMDVSKYPRLYWSPPPGYDSFNVYSSPSSSGPFTQIGSNLTTPTYVDVSGQRGLIYYQVTATWGSAYETSASNQVSYVHGYPNTITATASTTRIALAWTAVSGATGYSIYRSTQSGTGYGTAYATTASNSYSDTSITTNVGYYYFVTATFAAGPGEPSTEVSGMSPGTGTATNVPSGLTLTSTTATGAVFTWAKVNATASYKIYRAPTLTGTYVLQGTSPTLLYSAGGLTAGTTYYFKVSSVTSGVESAQSAALSVTPYGAVTAPNTVAGNQQIALTWTPATGATSYALTRSTDGVTFSAVPGASSLTNSYFVDGVTNSTPLVNGTLYFYIVAATFPTGTVSSPASTGVTVGIVPGVPAGITVTGNTSGNDLILTWGAVSQATSYNVYVTTTSGTYSSTATTSSSSTSADVAGLVSGTPYYFKVTALIGTTESAKSAEVEGIPFATPAAPVATMLPGNASVKINWSAISGVTSFDLQKSTDGVNFTTIPGAAGLATTSYTDSAVSAGIGYYYRYLPYMSGFPLTVSNVSTNVMTPGTTATTPLNLAGDLSATTGNVYLNWIQTPDTVIYNLYRSTTSGTYGTTPYAPITAPATSFTDTAATAGTTYYYVVRAVNLSGTESPNSNEVAISSLSAPGQPTATIANNAITVSWPTTGAASYIVRRQTAQTPATVTYGIVATVNGTSYVDTSVQNGVTYNYVVDSVSGSTVSADSPVVNATAIVTMNLEVPIELADQGLASNTSAITFGRTRTSLDPTAYDGTLTYIFELSATNSDSSAKTVSLLNSSGSVMATISVPAGTNSIQRLRSTFTTVPTTADTYFVSLPATTNPFQLSVNSVRMIVRQVGASKTKIFIPLLASAGNPVYADSALPVAQTASMSYGYLPTTTLYQRDTTVLSTLAGENAWELETITATTNGASGAVGLYDQNQGAPVADTESLFSSANETFIQAPFSEGVATFTTANQNDLYQVSMRCTAGCTNGSLLLYKAGLWVTLTSISKVQVYYRISLGDSTATTQTIDGERTRINLSNFTNPTTYFQAVGAELTNDKATVSLYSQGTNDSGTTGQSLIAGSALSFSSQTTTLNRTGAITLTDTYRYLPQVAPTSQTFNLIDSTIIINGTR